MPFLKQAFVRAFFKPFCCMTGEDWLTPHPQALSFACEFLLKYDV